MEEARAAIKAKIQEREELMRESWVRAMELRLVRAELDKCHKAEGVNHYENCRWLAKKYLEMLQEREHRAKGYKVIDLK